MVDRARVETLFRSAGVKPGDTVVAYCHIGQQGTAVVFGARLLGHQVVLYDGSMQDWASNKRGEIVK
jgi:thiosulfate/3-mercaptopyruvate sulfurtransferase